MNRPVPDFTPYIPSDAALAASELPDTALHLLSVSARLAGQIPATTRQTIVRHMAVINSYYSNLIEGNHTLPHEIRAAQADKFSSEPAKRDLQRESMAHIHVQAWLEVAKPDLARLYTPEFIQAIHQEFYQQMPASLQQIKDRDNNPVATVVPGAWRSHEVTVGQHRAPPYADVPTLMKKFCEAYHPDQYKGDRKVIAVMAAHHRLAWIHPFADGNGRVMRLFTDAALKAIGMESAGVWCLSRGLARLSSHYKSALAQADAPRKGGYDGRGVLSEQALIEFCQFMLDTAIDQATYISDLLKLEQMHQRIKNYVQARNDGRIPGLEAIKENAVLVLYNAFISGKLSRSLAIESCGMPERSARRLLAQLKQEGMLSDTSSRSDLSWEIPEHAEPWYFPQLTPY
ncbi:MAG: Fic family protein [Gammaproteobacteria bacterium]|nr:Fic family protein [Gammaproteobacteria bacterium]